MTPVSSPRAFLCPVDFSSNARLALRHADALARRLKARLEVLFVDDALLTEAAVRVGDTRRAARTMLDLRRFVAGTVTARRRRLVRCHVAVGVPGREIVAAATKLRCGVIVMGTQGVGGVRQWLLGSTTYDVLKRSAVPVLAIPPRH